MKYKVTLNGRTYEVEVEVDQAMLVDEYQACSPPAASPPSDAPATPPAAATPSAAPVPSAGGDVVAAPMPGSVLRVEVAQGATVKSGQLLVLLEAMKMENEILAPRDGTVSQIMVQKGSRVETGAPLLVLS